MTKKRIFVGIPVPEDTKKLLYQHIFSWLKSQHLRIIPPENYHITLHFIGNIDEEQIGDIFQKVEKVLEFYPPFTLVLRKIDYAPPGRHKKRMVWAYFMRNIVFSLLANELSYKLSRSLVSYPLPHITLSRFPEISERKLLPFSTSLPLMSLWCNKIVVYESVLQKKGAKYIELKQFDLLTF